MSAPTTRQWLRAAATRVYTGTGRLAAHHTRRAVGMARSVYGRLAAWVNTSTGVWWLAKIALLLFLASRARLVLGALAERAYERVDSGAWGWLLWTAATLWVVAAYRAGREEWQPSQRPTPMAPDSEQTEEADVEQT
ncbi:hypothetical protein PV398_46500, partial [Streptomyces ipomoeae]|nr:hypothetical protein [Streptomyces ipomoeae]